MTPLQTPQDRCYLLELPPELRNRIYEYFFAVKPGTDGTVGFGGRRAEEHKPFSVLSILQTCRQLLNLDKARPNAIRELTVSISEGVSELMDYLQSYRGLSGLEKLRTHYMEFESWETHGLPVSLALQSSLLRAALKCYPRLAEIKVQRAEYGAVGRHSWVSRPGLEHGERMMMEILETTRG